MDKKYLLCVSSDGYPESLEPRKLYEVVDDPRAASEGMVRIIDESGEDYLYPARCFADVSVPQHVVVKLGEAS